MSASKLAEQWLSGPVEREMCEYIAGTLDPRDTLKLMNYIIALRKEMALRVFEDTRERAAKIAADAIAPNRRDIADAIRAMKLEVIIEAIRAMQPDLCPK